MRIETTILKNLLHNEDYMRRAIPHIDIEYFSEPEDKVLFETIKEFIDKYNNCPTIEAITISIQNKNIFEQTYQNIVGMLDDLQYEEINTNWLLDETEKWCKDKSLYNAILKSIEIINGKDKVLGADALPTLLQDALSVSFNNRIGHDYIEDSDSRFDFYHKVENRVPFDIDMLNHITGGGLPNKTLSIILAGTNVGKSLVMCHVAASTLSQGKNVLYITLEMSEEEIAKRIDANLMNIPIGDLKNLHKDMFNNKIAKIKDKTNGKLIIHEYPTAGAHSGHFRALLNDLRLKKSFTPNMIIIDYLNICSSARLKSAQNVNSYSYIKSIAEEIRGLAVEYDVPILSATQTTRGGINNSDLELTDTSESIGLPATCDLLFAIMRNEELDLLNQILFKQLKNRFNDASLNRKFVVGVDRVKMKLYNIENSGQDSLITPDTSNYNNTLPPSNSNSKFKRDFSSIKV